MTAPTISPVFQNSPAPWGVATLPAMSADCLAITDAFGVELARLPHVVGDTPKDTRQRAKLISAAPEVLEALKDAKATITALAGDRESAVADECLARVSDAIAKAEGKA